MNLTYTFKLAGNKNKLLFLDNTLQEIQEVSNYIFNNKLNVRNKEAYHLLRCMFPSLYSKTIQKVMRNYLHLKKLKSAIKVPLTLDKQMFNIKFNNGYFNAFIKYHSVKFPMLGKYSIDKIKGKEFIEAKIIKRKLYITVEVPEIEKKYDNNKAIAIDVNVKNITFSDGHKISTKGFVLKKLKNNNIKNYTKDFIHKLSNEILTYTKSQGKEVLVLEDLKGIRKNFRKGKTLNRLIHNTFPTFMLKSFISYKSVNYGIKIKFVNPSYTSKTCSNCGSINTGRPKQNQLICHDCNKIHNADYNASKNILSVFTDNKGLIETPSILK
jgi:IS605 OrfB family transposase